jgi:hypothetical protein
MSRENHRLRVFENRELRRMFRPKTDAMIGGWRKLHNEELHNLYSSRNRIRMIKSRWMRWVGLVVRVGEKKTHTGFWRESQKERDHWEDLDVGGRIRLKWILEK